MSNDQKPRYGSLTKGTEAQKAKMRAVLFRNRIHRLQRQAAPGSPGKQFPKH
jgi:hypothetical protein